MTVSQEQLNAYMNCPSRHFASPQEVEHNKRLSTREKRKILESWKIDEKELLIATEENMGGPESDNLSRIVSALNRLN